ncbi:cytochrome b [Roseateles saccharophilus]|nr:cytochrome b [Roseateles saccharophilus]MDG0834688.1 cytochrome b [Roseateles saccharophilus]
MGPAHPSLQPSTRYTTTAIVLHWLVALGLVAAFCIGIYMGDLPRSPTKLQIYGWHRTAGITVLALVLARLFWRATHHPPADLPMPAWQATAAHALHGLMYALMLTVPLAGWAMSSAKGQPVVWFDVLTLPGLLPADRPLAHQLEKLHSLLSWVLLASVALHLAAALKHHVIDKDGLLDRMRPGKAA